MNFMRLLAQNEHNFHILPSRRCVFLLLVNLHSKLLTNDSWDDDK